MAELHIQNFRDHLVQAGIVDGEGVHHEFVGGMHGQKIDFDAIPDDSKLFGEWSDVVSAEVKSRYSLERYPKGIVLLSVAGGTNRLVGPVSKNLGQGYTPALTAKLSSKEVELTRQAEIILATQPDLILAIEDVGTAGTTSATAVTAARKVLPQSTNTRIEVLNTWQRSNRLSRLDEISAPYSSIIHENMIAYEPETCKLIGFCAVGWTFIPHE